MILQIRLEELLYMDILLKKKMDDRSI